MCVALSTQSPSNLEAGGKERSTRKFAVIHVRWRRGAASVSQVDSAGAPRAARWASHRLAGAVTERSYSQVAHILGLSRSRLTLTCGGGRRTLAGGSTFDPTWGAPGTRCRRQPPHQTGAAAGERAGWRGPARPRAPSAHQVDHGPKVAGGLVGVGLGRLDGGGAADVPPRRARGGVGAGARRPAAEQPVHALAHVDVGVERGAGQAAAGRRRGETLGPKAARQPVWQSHPAPPSRQGAHQHRAAHRCRTRLPLFITPCVNTFHLELESVPTSWKTCRGRV